MSGRQSDRGAESLAAQELRVLEETMRLDASDADITTQDAEQLATISNFDGVDDDLVLFQQNEIVREALAKGLDLRRYSQAVAGELKHYENMCVGDYIQHADELAGLHEEIRQCDNALNGMETLLSKFQHDLGSISKEISQLQSLSLSLGVRLKNHSAVDRRLTAYLKHTYISPDLKNMIMGHDKDHSGGYGSASGSGLGSGSGDAGAGSDATGGLSEQLGEALYALSRKLYFIHHPKVMETQAAKDVLPALKQLLAQSVTRVRRGLTDQIQSLKQPLTNIQVKQSVLVRHRRCYDFLLVHCQREGLGDIAAEMRQFYVEAISGTYLAQVKTYFASLKKTMTKSHVTKNDLMGVEVANASSGGFFGFGGSSPNPAGPGGTDEMLRIFSLGQRELGLGVGSTIALKHTAMQGALNVSFERAFKMLLQLVFDTATTEYHFLWDFFGCGADLNGSASKTEETPVSASGTSTATGATEAKAGDAPHRAKSTGSNSNSHGHSHTPSADSSEVHASTSGYFDYVDSSDEEEDQALAAANRFAALAVNMEGNVSLPPPPSVLEARNRTSIKAIIAETSQMMENDADQLKNLRAQHARSMFYQIFVKIFAYLEEILADHVAGCYDSLDLLLLARMISEYHQLMHQRRVYFVLDAFFERLNALVWPRFKQIFQANLHSLRTAKLAIQKKPPIRPHFTALRYAMYASALSYFQRAMSAGSPDTPVLALTPSGETSPTAAPGQTHAVVPVTGNVFLRDCINELHGVVDTLTQTLAGTIDVPKNRYVFRIVTYDLICRAMITHGMDIRTSTVLRDHYTNLQQAITEFINSELADKFGRLVNFVRDIEKQAIVAVAAAPASEDGSTGEQQVADLKIDDSAAEAVSRHFASNWKVLIEALGTSIRSAFDSKMVLIPAPPLAVSNLVAPTQPTGGNTSNPEHKSSTADAANAHSTPEVDELASSAMALFESHNTPGEIHKAALLQVGLYYRKFLDVLEQVYAHRQPAFLREVVPLQTVLQEIRRLSMR